MFQFSSFPPRRLWIQRRVISVHEIGFPHSDTPGYSACTRLPGAFRSVPRPSSALGTKASSVRPL